MSEQDLTPVVQELMAQMAVMQTELNDLKQRSQVLPRSIQPVKSELTTTRRNTLKRLGLALLGGVATATALGEASVAQARVIVNPQGNLANKVGMVVLLPGVPAPTGTLSEYSYGLIVSSISDVLDLNSLPGINTGVFSYGYLGVYGSGSNTGVYGNGNVGVQGRGSSVHGLFGGFSGSMNASTQVGVIGASGPGINLSAFGPNYNIGVYGTAAGNTNNYAGFFAGAVYIGGPLEKPAGSFKIDHPQDPANKYLYHSFVESPDMMNIYNGLVSLDNQGEATVEMPGWFEALNSDYRYGLTSIGAASPNLHIAQEISDLKFKIAGGLPGQKVSWQVTGIRQDAYAKAHRIPVEEAKNESEKGRFLHPELFGKPEEMGIGPRATPARAPV